MHKSCGVNGYLVKAPPPPGLTRARLARALGLTTLGLTHYRVKAKLRRPSYIYRYFAKQEGRLTNSPIWLYLESVGLVTNLQRHVPAQRQSLRTGRGLERMRFYFPGWVGGSKKFDSRGRIIAEG